MKILLSFVIIALSAVLNLHGQSSDNCVTEKIRIGNAYKNVDSVTGATQRKAPEEVINYKK